MQLNTVAVQANCIIFIWKNDYISLMTDLEEQLIRL